MSRYVTLPAMNQPMAIATIKEYGLDVSRAHKWFFYDFHSSASRDMFVDCFMRHYPRGKGTRGDEVLRKVFSACHAIKVAHSRSRYRYRAKPIPNDLAPTYVEMLITMPGDGAEIELPAGGIRHYLRLHELGLISGWITRGGSFWLTDHGLATRAALVKRRDFALAQAREDRRTECEALVREIAKIEVSDDTDVHDILRGLIEVAKATIG